MYLCVCLSLSLSLSVSVSISLSVCLSVCLSVSLLGISSCNYFKTGQCHMHPHLKFKYVLILSEHIVLSQLFPSLFYSTEKRSLQLHFTLYFSNKGFQVNVSTLLTFYHSDDQRHAELKEKQHSQCIYGCKHY